MNETDTIRESAPLLLTAEGYRALQEELEQLTSVKRPEIANRIRESLEHGEFSEDNSELDEVKFEQAIVESRIAELKTIFASASVMEVDKIPTDRVGVGSLVTVRDEEFSDDFAIRLVASIEADPNKDLISTESPMGLAMYGRVQGEEFEVLAPSGKKLYKVMKIER